MLITNICLDREKITPCYIYGGHEGQADNEYMFILGMLITRVDCMHTSTTKHFHRDMYAGGRITTIEVTTTEEITKTNTITTTEYLPGGYKLQEVATAGREGAVGQDGGGLGQVEPEDVRSAWYDGSKQILWAILAGVVGWL